MASTAHSLYCFEVLAASLQKRDALPLSRVEELWAEYETSSAELSAPKPRNLAHLQAPSPADRSSASTPSTISSASSRSALSDESKASSQTSLGSSSRTFTKDGKHPLFVTWNTLSPRSGHKSLRGCIGTFEGQDLARGLKSYSLTSAFDDVRFSPITLVELPSLSNSVTLLLHFEPCDDPLDWEVGVHGLRISFTERGRKYSSTYLPDVASEQGWGKEETVVSLMRKAGWSGSSKDWAKVGVSATRYQGMKASVDYVEWRRWRDWVERRERR